MKTVLKTALMRYTPDMTDKVLSTWRRYHANRFDRQQGLGELGVKFKQRNGLKVLSGPFKGMNYVPDAVGSALVPKLLGSYELELHDALSELVQQNITTIVDIGCAEGFYAVGLAMRFPAARIYAFDTELRARTLCNEMARINGVSDRVFVGGLCEPQQLNKLLLPGNALIICDCEGCEYDLLRFENVPRLGSAYLLLELHPPFSRPTESIAEASKELLQSFERTHSVTLIQVAPRELDLYSALENFSSEERQKAVAEWRPSDQMWAYMKPKADHS